MFRAHGTQEINVSPRRIQPVQSQTLLFLFLFLFLLCWLALDKMPCCGFDIIDILSLFLLDFASSHKDFKVLTSH